MENQAIYHIISHIVKLPVCTKRQKIIGNNPGYIYDDMFVLDNKYPECEYKYTQNLIDKQMIIVCDILSISIKLPKFRKAINSCLIDGRADGKNEKGLVISHKNTWTWITKSNGLSPKCKYMVCNGIYRLAVDKEYKLTKQQISQIDQALAKLFFSNNTVIDNIMIVHKKMNQYCVMCKKRFEQNEITHDSHIFAKARGGTKDKWNIVICCATCNTQMQDKNMNFALYDSLEKRQMLYTSNNPMEYTLCRMIEFIYTISPEFDKTSNFIDAYNNAVMKFWKQHGSPTEQNIQPKIINIESKRSCKTCELLTIENQSLRKQISQTEKCMSLQHRKYKQVESKNDADLLETVISKNDELVAQNNAIKQENQQNLTVITILKRDLQSEREQNSRIIKSLELKLSISNDLNSKLNVKQVESKNDPDLLGTILLKNDVFVAQNNALKQENQQHIAAILKLKQELQLEREQNNKTIKALESKLSVLTDLNSKLNIRINNEQNGTVIQTKLYQKLTLQNIALSKELRTMNEQLRNENQENVVKTREISKLRFELEENRRIGFCEILIIKFKSWFC